MPSLRLTGADATQEKVRDRLAALPIRPDDSILCYYSGPATYDDATKAYTLTAGGAKLPRSELRARIQLHKPGLIVLLTDAPSNAVKVDNLPPLPFPASVAPLKKLLLDSKGLIDLNAWAASETAFPAATRAACSRWPWYRSWRRAATWASAVAGATATLDRLYKQYRAAVLMSDTVPADEKRAYREQASQTLTPLSLIDPTSATPAIPDVPTLPQPAGETIRTLDAPPRPPRSSSACRPGHGS